MLEAIQSLTIVSVAAAASTAACALIVLSQRWHGKHSFDHDLDGVQKFHTEAVPRVGGIAVLAAVCMTVVFFLWFAPELVSKMNVITAIFLLIASVPAFVMGITEDITKKVSVRGRLVGTMLSALMASWLLGATLHGLDIWGFDRLMGSMPVALLVTAIVVSGGANAINIVDGFNGLAGSVIAIMAAALGFLGWQAGDGLVTMLALLAVGASLGFLVMNFPTGRLFLGDGGAYFLGFWVAEIAVLLLVRNAGINAWQVLSICAYPIIEVLFSIYRRKFLQQASPGSPDGLHLHTLVYRRVVSRLLPYDAAAPWRRNAAVTCMIVPWLALMAVLSVFAGATIRGAIAVVVLQGLAYMVVYARLVRGRWRRGGAAEPTQITDDAAAEINP